MGKKKKDKRGKGAEKTALKTEKNAERKAKKALKEHGEDDIEKLIAEFQHEDRKRGQVSEEKCEPPSRRCNMTLTAHPDKDELVLFGGEFFNGSKTFMYNDLFFYNIKTNEWSRVKTPEVPPPRCAHQAVAMKQGGGQLWIFGGEFASPTQSQFYHYKDLWVYHIKDKRWEKIHASGGPSARSGHRMGVCKKNLYVFGGFHDNVRDYKYFNDLYNFDLETFNWTKLKVSGIPPAPRSACQMAVTQDQRHLIIYGGYSKEKVKRDVDKGCMHTDMFMITLEGKGKEECSTTDLKWVLMKQSGVKPSPRCGFSLVVTPGNRAVFFGGVFDQEDSEEEVTGVFYNEMYTLELGQGKWHEVVLKGKREQRELRRRRKQKEKNEEEKEAEETDEKVSEDCCDMEVVEETAEEMEGLRVESGPARTECEVDKQNDHVPDSQPEDSIFKVTVGPQTSSGDDIFKVTVGDPIPGQSHSADRGGRDNSAKVCDEAFVPCARMNTLMAVKHGVLYLYGGMFEEGDKQVTLQDMYSLDLHKLDQWNVLRSDDAASQEWHDSDSSSDEDEGDSDKADAAVGGEDSEDEDSEDSEEDEKMEEDPPPVTADESNADYFSRTKDFWLRHAEIVAKKEAIEVSSKKIKKAAQKMAEEFFHKGSASK